MAGGWLGKQNRESAEKPFGFIAAAWPAVTGFDRPAQGTWNPATQGDASSLLLGLQAHHGSGLSSGWTLLGALVATQVAVL